MARYQSRLTAVLKTRKHRQEAVKRELSEQWQHLSREETTLQSMVASSKKALNGLRERQEGLDSPVELALYYQFVKQQTDRIKVQERKVAAISETVKSKRQELEQATQEKKMVEKIEANRKAAYNAMLNKKESNFLDEVAGRMKQGME